jgi:hypothetical protein
MPVSVLLCEGGDNSPDARLLARILFGTGVVIEPTGGKDGFPNLIRSRRRADPRVCGLADGDFPRKPDVWVRASDPGPPPWRARIDEKDVMLGWKWRRKEVENYFIDPDILTRALGWEKDRRAQYVAQLSGVLDALGHVTAARIALTACAPHRTRVDTRVRLHGTKEALEDELRTRASAYNKGALLEEKKLLEAFASCIPECLPGGRFRSSALEVFAGKNIFAKIQNTAGFTAELKNVDELEERVLEAMERDGAAYTWLPEWAALRSAVEGWEAPAS